ncbi:MAG: hypothetical protein V4638_02330 [Bacteroidota bacterium]
MNKFRFGISLVVLTGMILPSCIKHEIIPPPEPVIELTCNFYGVVNGTDVELTQNVNGYDNLPTKEKIILSAPQLSSATYYARMGSAQSQRYVQVGLGSIQWDASAVNDPSLTQFNDFFLAATTPPFSDGAVAGFEFEYRDANGKIWNSHAVNPNAQAVAFTNIVQESDAAGDYSKFQCNFSCYVYNQDVVTLLWDSIPVQNATLKAWFKR